MIKSSIILPKILEYHVRRVDNQTPDLRVRNNGMGDFRPNDINNILQKFGQQSQENSMIVVYSSNL